MKAVEKLRLRPTEVYDSYWRFAAERQNVFLHRARKRNSPLYLEEPLKSHRFTNSYRVLDRVSQFLVASVQGEDGSDYSFENIVFRTLLFKIFNKIETWKVLNEHFGGIQLHNFSFSKAEKILSSAKAKGPIYSAAYIMPSPMRGANSKHANHLRLLAEISSGQTMEKLQSSTSLRDVYNTLVNVKGLGPFLAFQYAIDLCYSNALGFSESDFVVAGPGAEDGIAKCFQTSNGHSNEAIIMAVCEDQEFEFEKRGIVFDGIPNRPLQPIDCQNLFCEISKYARVAHPEIQGVNSRTRIKQKYKPSNDPLQDIQLPPHWGISDQEISTWINA